MAELHNKSTKETDVMSDSVTTLTFFGSKSKSDAFSCALDAPIGLIFQV